ncbi:CDP-glucose 4,6-dehydratase [Polynucleobacter sp. Nonnen-W13]|uniref:CDP-glucose 4,6-dehydratase n=1 Tax=Polynucleobacter sp. Nonnen-W13 TaxID=1855625 RepID=UPI001C0CF820|nr:CDP-glucose 4,6-dehydratase [Polynucleobacter sp. Nonnen-W13]MBU3558354.1 CDP-glucose 4,6-dehydratase [Polynucleobacter sp. Nonnen-W13]
MNANFWYKKRVLVTGHTGFKGAWLCLWLQKMGADILGFSLPPSSKSNLFEMACVDKGMASILADIRNFERLCIEVKEFKPEIIIHMAAQALVLESYKSPVNTYSTNIMGTVNILEASRMSDSVKVVINVTTDKCYENKEWFWGYRENEAMGGWDPYSSSKGCSELVTSAYRNSFFNPSEFNNKHSVVISTARAGNVIGGGDWSENRLIPDILDAYNKNEMLAIRNPSSIRPWQFVLEPLGAYLELAEKMYESGIEYGQAWNIGPQDNDVQTVGWIVERMSEFFEKKIKRRIDGGNENHEAMYLKLDTSKIKSKLCWEPKVKLIDALQLIVEWNRRFTNGESPRLVSEDQIDHYMSLMKDKR